MAKKKINGNLLNIQLVDVRPHYSFHSGPVFFRLSMTD